MVAMHYRVPLWMRLLGSAWTGRLLVLAGLAAFSYAAYHAQPEGWWPWTRLALIWVGPPIAFTFAVTLLIGRGDLRCGSCRKLTRYAPMPRMFPGMSQPHLRCNHCGETLWGM